MGAAARCSPRWPLPVAMLLACVSRRRRGSACRRCSRWRRCRRSRPRCWPPAARRWSSTRRGCQFTLALDPPGAILLGVAALLWSAAGLYAWSYLRRPAECRPLRGLVAADADRQPRRLLRRRPRELLSAVRPGQPGGLGARDPRRHAARACAPASIYLVLAVLGEICLLAAFALLAAADPGRQPGDPRRRRRCCRTRPGAA